MSSISASTPFPTSPIDRTCGPAALLVSVTDLVRLLRACVRAREREELLACAFFVPACVLPSPLAPPCAHLGAWVGVGACNASGVAVGAAEGYVVRRLRGYQWTGALRSESGTGGRDVERDKKDEGKR
ncbi:hypothetical protein B0H17DRAFT_1190519 [Mycena rosella]|uniref:Uncharacterized protein n=1 Tax=Mycena rosella TaxID=1033263 RepID=A0AAD7MCM5_MYCRO|nr:hypothetical protein B0H17DRAFT_1190519 [Mycena rosella]